jgi:hypothetical protein
MGFPFASPIPTRFIDPNIPSTRFQPGFGSSAEKGTGGAPAAEDTKISAVLDVVADEGAHLIAKSDDGARANVANSSRVGFLMPAASIASLPFKR